ncbi:MAG: hypothetical protein IJA62_05610 [Ruminococcus sp.]|nr:hypothetical protein [Ruminococcus sp.]
MKHSTFRKSSLISSVALLLVAIVALSGATFAWFSTASLATATGINATTTQGSNLTISDAKDTGFTQDLVLTGDDVQKEMSPVTTDNLSTWWTAKAEKYNSQKAYGGYTEDKSGENYIKKTIYVKYDAADGNTHNLKLNVAPAVKTVQIDEENTKAIGTLNYYRVAVAPSGANDQDITTIDTYTTKYFANNITAQYPDGYQHAQYTAQQFGEIEIGTINANDVYAFDVYVWFEGEDIDCKDTDAVNDIDLVLEFK